MSDFPYQPVSDAEANNQEVEAYPVSASPQCESPQQSPPPSQQYLPPPHQYPLLQVYALHQKAPPQYEVLTHPETAPTYKASSDTSYNGTAYGVPGISLFSELSVRQGFIKKVYSILFLQLLVSIGIMCLFVLHPDVNNYTRRSLGMFYSAWAAIIIIMIVIACTEKARRYFPLNIFMLALFTLCESYLLGVLTAHYKINHVLIAMVIITFMTLAIILFAFQSTIDFTMMSGCLLLILVVLICFGFLTILLDTKTPQLLYTSLGALAFGFYLVLDTQLMMGDSKQFSLRPEEYVFASLNLYVDIITLFMFILQVVGKEVKKAEKR